MKSIRRMVPAALCAVAALTAGPAAAEWRPTKPVEEIGRAHV